MGADRIVYTAQEKGGNKILEVLGATKKDNYMKVYFFLKKSCKDFFLKYFRLYRYQDIHRQRHMLALSDTGILSLLRKPHLQLHLLRSL